MLSHKRTLLLLLGMLAIAIATSIATMQGKYGEGKDQKKYSNEEFNKQFPMTDYLSSEPSDQNARAVRQSKSKKYNDAQLPLNPSASADTVISSTLHWTSGLTALPVAQSQAVVVGQVVDAQAYLSEDKTAIYSEFSIRITEVLKNDSSNQLIPECTLAVEREGGRVRFPSGHTALSFTNGQGMPHVGAQYVFFLTHSFPLQGLQEKDFYLLTGYELRAGRVFPLDNPDGGTHPLAITYKDASAQTLLSDLRSAINKSITSIEPRSN